MTGKRVKKRRWQLPGALLVVTAAGLLLTLGGPRGAAVNSPLANADRPEDVQTSAVPETPAIPEEPVPVEMPEEPTAPPEPEEPVWAGPVPESEPVEDTYFDDAVFLGDSRTDGFRLYSGLKTGEYFCATGATVESVFTKSVDTPRGKMPLLDALAKTECGKIYVMLGVNELGWSGTDTFRNQSTKLLERLREDHPDAEIILQSLLPVSAKQDAKKSYVNNQRVNDYNGVWKELAEELDLSYVNVAEAVTGEDGCLPAELTFDGVHLNPEGCAIWLEYLRTHSVENAGT